MSEISRQVVCEPSKTDSWRIFDRIANRYDLLNRILSLGIDIMWRQAVAKSIETREALTVLDVATGTGDQLLSILKNSPQVKSACGIDMSHAMLKIAKEKIEQAGFASRVELLTADFTSIPREPDHFDVVTISFGIRNSRDTKATLKEMFRVLKPGGEIRILEFSIPRNRFVRASYLLYLRYVLPKIGRWFSGDLSAYTYLNKTIESFPHGEDFLRLLDDAGFEDMKFRPLTLGVVNLYEAKRKATA